LFPREQYVKIGRTGNDDASTVERMKFYTFGRAGLKLSSAKGMFNGAG